MTEQIRSPFLVFSEFLSNKACETILDSIKVIDPDIDQDGVPMNMERTEADSEQIIYQKLKDILPEIEERYTFKSRGIEKIKFQLFPENPKKPARMAGCENSQFLRKKWVKIKDVDLTGVIWLKEYQDTVPLDTKFEVYGGKLEFPTYDFSLVPQRGTLVLFPAYPHFINCISPVLVSDLYQVKINIAGDNPKGGPWLYHADRFGSGGKSFIEAWFKEFL